jgi:hypothetical protein
MNTIRKKKKKSKVTSGKFQKSAGQAGRVVRDVFGGEMLKSGTFKHLPFLVFIAFLAFVYIANNYYAENKVRDINKLRKELKELRYEYITSKSKLMNLSKQSQIADRLSDKGVKESTDPIKTIYAKPDGR